MAAEKLPHSGLLESRPNASRAVCQCSARSSAQTIQTHCLPCGKQ